MGAFFKPSEEPGVKRAKRSGATLIPGSSDGTLCATIAEQMSAVARSLWRKTLSLSPPCGWVHFKLPKWVKSKLALTSVRRECLDHVLILHEKQLYRVLRLYVEYFNQSRPHKVFTSRFRKGRSPAFHPGASTFFTRLSQSGFLRTIDVLTRMFRGSTKAGEAQFCERMSEVANTLLLAFAACCCPLWLSPPG
jgi:hypothetical protein